MIDSESKKWAALIHLAGLAGYVIPFGHIFGPLVVWLMKKDGNDFVDENGKSAINFQISLTIYSLVGVFFFFISFFATMSGGGFFAFPMMIGAVFIFYGIELLLIALAASSAYSGKVYRYPLTIRFLK